MNTDVLAKPSAIIFGIIYIILGICRISEVCLEDYQDILFCKNAETCYAHVDYVNEYLTRETRGRTSIYVQHYDAYIHYSVGDERFRNIEIPGVTPRKKGDVILIYYNPDNPSEFVIRNTFSEKGSTVFLGGFQIIGGTCFMLCGMFCKVNSRQQSRFC